MPNLPPVPVNGSGTFVDVIHGNIALLLPKASMRPEPIGILLSQPPLDRLRRLKQLSFASHVYSSADHTRLAHALGTYRVMWSLKDHLSLKSLPDQLSKNLMEYFPAAFNRESKVTWLQISRHLLLAALTQDIGELPYAHATEAVFSPAEPVETEVGELTGSNFTAWTRKDLFTAGLLLRLQRERNLPDDIDLALLLYLITGHMAGDVAPPEGLAALRLIVDGGPVDADRLDYVFRDAYHTLGSRGHPQAVVDSLVRYEAAGPVFDQPGPVANLLYTRLLLSQNVYYAPASRFRSLLVMTLLREIRNSEVCTRTFANALGIGKIGRDFRLSLDDFLKLDDVSLNSAIRILSGDTDTNRELSPRGQAALELLLERGPEYTSLWLPPREWSRDLPETNLPSELFHDTLADLEDHSSYEAGSVQVESSIFSQYGSIKPLEDCSGMFSALLIADWHIGPQKGSMLIFQPRRGHSSAGAWRTYDKALHEGWLYERLTREDSFALSVPTDTWNKSQFNAPRIFISARFSREDKRVLERLIEQLHARRRQYKLLIDPVQAGGGTARLNSIEAVKQSHIVFIVLSLGFLDRLSEDQNGLLSAELKEVGERSQKEAGQGTFHFEFLTLDDIPIDDLRVRLPWRTILQLDDVPFLGIPLRHASITNLNRVLDTALERAGTHLDPT